MLSERGPSLSSVLKEVYSQKDKTLGMENKSVVA